MNVRGIRDLNKYTCSETCTHTHTHTIKVRCTRDLYNIQ